MLTQQERVENWTIYYSKKKNKDKLMSRVCPVIDNEFCHNSIKVVYHLVDPKLLWQRYDGIYDQ